MNELETLENGRSHAVASPFGGHLLSCSVDGRDLLYLSPLSDPSADQPARGGVPICFPWFGNGPGGDLVPSHGFARSSRWSLTDRSASLLSWQWDGTGATGNGRDLWPHSFLATCTQSLTGDGVQVALNVANSGDVAFTYEALLHTYILVGDAAATRLEGLSGSTYLDKRDGFRPKLQDGDVGFAEPLDRIYTSAGDVTVHDIDRILLVQKQGSASTVVWNPGEQAPDDVPPGDWRRFVCVEAGNVGEHAITLEPGADHTLTSLLRLA